MSVNNLMLVSLSISHWTARKYDKKVSRKLTTDYGTVESAARVNKNLMPWDVPSYNVIQSTVSKSRADFYRETLPWGDDHRRALPSMNHLKLAEIMRENREVFESSNSIFRAEAPQLFQAARFKLGDMWRAEDYPTPEKLAKKFSFSLRFEPVPDAADFRVTELAEADVLAIQEQIDAAQQEGIKNAVGDLYARLNQVIEHMHGRLAGSKVCNCAACKGREFKTDEFHDSLVTNVKEVCDVLPRLNFTNDPKLEQYRVETIEALTQFEAPMLRESDALRGVVRDRAEQILADMSAVMGVAA